MLKSKNNAVTRMAFADGLRAIAAMWVVLYHLSEGHHVDQLKESMSETFRTVLFDSGGLGVAIFFVLSGYVMAYTMRRDQTDLKLAGQFLLRRLVRLSPPYYFAIVVSLFFLWLKARFTGVQIAMPDVPNMIAHLFYATDFLRYPLLNSVFWTLGIEVQFYIAFALMVFFADWLSANTLLKNARFAVTVVVSLLALAWPFKWMTSILWPGGFIAVWYCFMLGVMVCWASGQQENSFKPFSIFYIALITLSGILGHEVFAITAALTGCLLFFAEQKGYMATWLNWSAIQKIGLISYSLYLLHNPLTGATANVVRRVMAEGVLTDLIIFTVSICVCLIAAWLTYIIIELPSIEWSRKVSHVKKAA